MSNHRVRYLGEGDQMQARCSCKQKSGIGSRGDCYEWAFAHHQQIERVRAQLGSRTPSLKSQQEWFQAQADDVENTQADRVLWYRLADELESFIDRKTAALSQDPLPF